MRVRPARANLSKVERPGYTLLPLDLHDARERIKFNTGLAKARKMQARQYGQVDQPACTPSRYVGAFPWLLTMVMADAMSPLRSPRLAGMMTELVVLARLPKAST